MRMIHPTSWRYYHNNNVILPITKMMILLVVVMVIYHVVPHSSNTNMVSSFHMVTPKRTRMMHHSNHHSPLPLVLLRLNEHSCTKSTIPTLSSSAAAPTVLVKSQHFDPNPFVRNHNRIITTTTNNSIVMRMMMISSSSILVLLVSLFPSVSYAALDMEAFAAQQLQPPPPQIVMTAPTSSRISSSSTTTSTNTDTMTPDEALCRFGQPGLLKGDACVRAHMSTAPKTKQGVDAYGNIQSRNTYPKCTKQYTLVDQQYYTSEWICQ